jgi:hypothetical protein
MTASGFVLGGYMANRARWRLGRLLSELTAMLTGWVQEKCG